MPRTARMVIPDEQAVFHVMSRTALDDYPMGSVEKDFLLKYYDFASWATISTSW